jgi:hypothetical protein
MNAFDRLTYGLRSFAAGYPDSWRSDDPLGYPLHRSMPRSAGGIEVIEITRRLHRWFYLRKNVDTGGTQLFYDI